MEQSDLTDKVKTAPTSLEKRTLSWLPDNYRDVQTRSYVAQTGRFLRHLHLFFGSPDEVIRLRDFVHFTGRFVDNHYEAVLTFYKQLLLSGKNKRKNNVAPTELW